MVWLKARQSGEVGVSTQRPVLTATSSFRLKENSVFIPTA